MTEYSGPFESSGSGLQESDWLTLEDVVQPYSGIVANYGNELVVSQHSPLAAMSVDVATGAAVVKSSRYKNGAVKTVTIDAADSTLDRYDIIVVQRTLNAPSSTIITTVHKGTNYTAGTAVPPSPTQNSTVWELVLATVFVAHGTVSITSGMITDSRLTTDCGYYTPAVGGLTINATTGNFDFDSQQLINLADPGSDQAADTKAARTAALAAYAPAGSLINYTVLSPGSGTFTTQSATTWAEILIIGGGGGSGGDYAYASGGGGSGARLKLYHVTLTGATGYSYTVGAAGTAGNSSGTNGGNGGASSITIGGTTYTAAYGSGGGGGISGYGSGGSGGSKPSNGDEGFAGNAGGNGSGATGGSAGAEPAGSLSYGNGGAGVGSTTTAGNVGQSGVIIIREYA